MKQEQKQYLEQFWQDIKKAGATLRTTPMPELKKEDFFLFKETGNRLVYEAQYFGRRKYLTVFGILAEYGGDSADIEKLSQVMESICDEQCWALPAHVDFEALDTHTIDLFAAETAQSLMEIIALFGKRLPQRTIDKVIASVTERVLVPFATSKKPYSWWEEDCCNWSAVCAGSVGMAAIYLSRWYEENGCKADARLPKDWKEAVIRRVCDALQCYLDGMEADGACTEGLGYFAYGMSYYTGFAELLYEDTGGKVNLMQRPKVDKIALFQQKCYFGAGVSVSFSDGSSRESFLPGLTAYLKACFSQVETPDYALARGFDGDSCYRWLMNERNIRWLISYAKDEESPKKAGWCYELLPAAQWLVCSDGYGCGWALKGGHNAENHNHNDIGHFLCVYKGELLLTDLGAGEYTKDYFSEGRYTILCNRSLGHSVPLINGMEQCAGREYAADAFLWDETAHRLTVSFGGAYPQGCIGAISRSICPQETDSGLVLEVEDIFTKSAQTQSITENLVTQYPPKTEGSRILLCGAESCAVIEAEGIEGAIHVYEKPHSNHAGEAQSVYLIQWQVPLETARCRLTITCLTNKNE